MNKTISNKKNQKKYFYLSWIVYQTVLPSTYTSFTEVSIPILTPISPWCLAGCFPLAFLAGQCSLLSPGGISLHLDPMIWNPSVLSKRVVFFTSTLFWSCWRYSNFFFFFFFSAILLFLAFSLALASASFLAFWAAYLAQCAFAASSNWARSYCSSSCLCCISCCCSSSILVLFWKMLERIGEDIVI